MHKPTSIIVMMLIAALSHAGVPEAGDEVNAKIARIKSIKAAAGDTKDATESGRGDPAANLNQLDGGCNIAIGNIIDGNKDGVATSATRETTVVVTGDIVQAGNKCQ